MEQLVDLHTHSTASDGQYPPATLVEKAAAAGIHFASCKWTFHDLLEFICDTIFCYVDSLL